MRNTLKVKMFLLKVLGENITAYFQAVRFFYMLTYNRSLVYEPERELLKYFLSPGGVAIDIGANGADWTFAIHKIVTQKGEIFAFEADPYYAKATEMTIKLMRMKEVTFFPFGLSEKNERGYLRVLDDKGQKLAGLSYINENGDNSKYYQKVTLKSLDSIALEFPDMYRASFIKCDVEGHELQVFRGSMQVIKKARPVVIFEAGSQSKQNEIINIFREINYQFFTLPKSPNRIMIPAEKVQRFQPIHGLTIIKT